MLIAVPCEDPGGLDAVVSEHFGHCAAFTLVAVEDGQIGEVSVLENSGHDQGGCMAPVHLLKGEGVEVLVAGGMGMRPLAGFQSVGIAVHFKEDARSVRDAVTLFLAGGCRAFGESETCSSGCGGHHQEEVQREPIVGRADVRSGRAVTLEFILRDANGELLDSSERRGPIRYLHGSGRLLPALERAIDGLEPGARVVVEVPRAEGFGDRDGSRVIQVPRAQLPPDVSVGNVLAAEDPSGNRQSFTVVELDEASARLDGNHPFAGRDLVFEVAVLEVESATADEIAHGHLH
jgi:FKBP-type peptidyl-prolyl cis-trans isomerase 2/predicted Fe-Mo cluster-binding NifX family protein